MPTVRRGPVLAGIAAGMLALTSSPAVAADNRTLTLDASDPLAAKALQICYDVHLISEVPYVNNDCKVTYDPTAYRAAPGPEHPVGDRVLNYASTTVTHTLAWTDTVTSSDSFEVSSSVKSTIWGAAEVAVTAKYTKTWTRSSTVSQTNSLPVPACNAGWFSRAAEMGTATGDLRVDFDRSVKIRSGTKKRYKHVVIKNSTFSAPTGKNDLLIARSRPMTAEERGACPS
ncbi:hypothetical protein BJP40_07400 [Streptomyces sp. CC53]|uniref:hypothetical protein n=1 Tax=unclassified Streptomyces TaxID=2593676 RepID=UPI0008DC713D|nr:MULTISPECIES: hypothetical protein [unclassified Streptomyces]OII61053.1 hypothetical protein BJP40_07400 [Streptomyces sp. CC53]